MNGSLPINKRLGALLRQTLQAATLWRLLTLQILLLSLAACTLQPVETSTEARQWELRGKLGFRSPVDSGSALINWQQRDDNYRIRLSGPLGAGAIDINGTVPSAGNKGSATFRQGGRPARHSDNIDALLQEILGWHLPVASALHWVRGEPSGASDANVTRADNGDLAAIREAGWTVDYLRFAGEGEQRLPAKLRLSREDMRLTLIIKQWRAPRPSSF